MMTMSSVSKGDAQLGAHHHSHHQHEVEFLSPQLQLPTLRFVDAGPLAKVTTITLRHWCNWVPGHEDLTPDTLPTSFAVSLTDLFLIIHSLNPTSCHLSRTSHAVVTTHFSTSTSDTNKHKSSFRYELRKFQLNRVGPSVLLSAAQQTSVVDKAHPVADSLVGCVDHALLALAAHHFPAVAHSARLL